MNRTVCVLLLAVFLVGMCVGYFLSPRIQRLSVPELTNLDPYIEELFESEKGGIIILTPGEYRSSIIYGPKGFIRWGVNDER